MWQLTEENKRTLAFMDEMAERALTESRTGDTSLINALSAKSKGFAYYFTNVKTLRSATPEQFAIQFPQFLKEGEMLRKELERAEKADANEERLNKIEAELAKLPDLIKEALAEAVAATKPVEAEKPAKRGKAKAEETPEPVVEAAPEDENDDEPEGDEGDNAATEA